MCSGLLLSSRAGAEASWADGSWGLDRLSLDRYTRDTRSIDTSTTTRTVSSAAVMPCLSDDTHSAIDILLKKGHHPPLHPYPVHPFTHPLRQTSQAIRSTLHFTSRLGTTDRLRLVPSLPPALPCLSSLLSALEEKLAPYDEKPILHTSLSVVLHHAGTVRLTSQIACNQKQSTRSLKIPLRTTPSSFVSR